MVRLREIYAVSNLGLQQRSRSGSRQSKGKASAKSMFTLICIVSSCYILLKSRASLGDVLRMASGASSLKSHRYAPERKVQGTRAPSKARNDKFTEGPANYSDGLSWYSNKPRSVQKGLVPTWTRVLARFMAHTSIPSYSASVIEQEYNANLNNVQDNSVLIKIRGGEATFITNFPAKRHTRFSSVVHIIQTILREPSHEIPDVTFMVMLSDGHKPHVPTFGAARHWKSWTNLIPVPMGNTRGYREGSGTQLDGWDAYIDRTIASKHELYPWNSKFGRAVFRGTLAMQTYTLGSCNAGDGKKCARATRWDQVNRGVMYKRAWRRRDLFDISFTKHGMKADAGKQQMMGAPLFEDRLRFEDFQLYKYVLCVGSNQDWAERLRNLLFMNSVVVLHSAETEEFFYPLLEPWKHIIPVNLMMTDLVKNVKWAVSHDEEVRKMVGAMNHFAKLHLSEHSMTVYWKLVLREFAARQRLAEKSDTAIGQDHGLIAPGHDRSSHGRHFESATKDHKELSASKNEISAAARDPENRRRPTSPFFEKAGVQNEGTGTATSNLQGGLSESIFGLNSTAMSRGLSQHVAKIDLAGTRRLKRTSRTGI
jgi:hypothetical protein